MSLSLIIFSVSSRLAHCSLPLSLFYLLFSLVVLSAFLSSCRLVLVSVRLFTVSLVFSCLSSLRSFSLSSHPLCVSFTARVSFRHAGAPASLLTCVSRSYLASADKPANFAQHSTLNFHRRSRSAQIFPYTTDFWQEEWWRSAVGKRRTASQASEHPHFRPRYGKQICQ